MNHKPVSNGYAMVILFVAAIFDGLSFIPGINEVTAIVGQVLVAGLFHLSGSSVWRARAAILYGATTIIELIPGANALPMFLVESIALILISRRRAK